MTDLSKLPPKIQKWAKGRARPGQVTTDIAPKRLAKAPEKNAGLPDGEFENDHLHCPCTICGHTYQAECEEAAEKAGGDACHCCSSTCT